MNSSPSSCSSAARRFRSVSCFRIRPARAPPIRAATCRRRALQGGPLAGDIILCLHHQVGLGVKRKVTPRGRDLAHDAQAAGRPSGGRHNFLWIHHQMGLGERLMIRRGYHQGPDPVGDTQAAGQTSGG